MSVRFLSGAFVALALALPLTLVAGIAAPQGAYAAGLATPVGNLPSMVQTGTGYTDAGKAGNSLVAAMAYLYKGALSPEAYAAYKARQTGAIPSAPQVAAEDYHKGQFTAPASPPSKLVKGLTGASTAISGYAIGTEVGSFAGQPIFNAFGIDANGAVCSASKAGGVVQKLLELGTGQDCATFNAAKDYAPNTDVSGGELSSDVVCFETTCMQLAGSFTWMTSSGSSDWAVNENRQAASGPQQITAYCFKAVSGSPRYPVSVTTKGKPSGNAFDTSSGFGAGRYWPSPYDCGPGSLAIAWPKSSGALDPVTGFKLTNTAPFTPAQSAPSNPDRYISCDVTGAGGEYASQAGGMFTETDTDWTKAFPQCPGLPAEVIVTKTAMVLHVVGGGDTTLSESTLPQPLVQDLAKYRECFGTSVCALELEKNGESCFAGNQTQCTDWLKDPNQSQYTCKYGSPGNQQTVSLTECKGVYAPTFQPETVRTGDVYGNPITGTPEPVHSKPTNPGTDKGQFAAPVKDPSADRECFPSGWGAFNPLNWVMQPVKCAMEWAFVPKPSAITAAQTNITTALDTSGLGTLTRNASQLALVGIPGGGCGGIPLKFDLGGRGGVNVDTHLLNACPGETLAPVAATTKTILSGLIVTAGFLAILRYVATIFGFSGLGGIQQQFAMSDRRAEQAAKDAAK